MTALSRFRECAGRLKQAEADLKHAVQQLENAPSLHGCPWHVGQTIKSDDSGDLIRAHIRYQAARHLHNRRLAIQRRLLLGCILQKHPHETARNIERKGLENE